MGSVNALLIVLSIIPIVTRSDLLSSKFTRYEILKPDMLRMKAKRDLVSGNIHGGTVSFSALGKLFVLELFHGAHTLHPGFHVDLVDSRGARTPFTVDRKMFYSGHIQGEFGSGVDISRIGDIWVGGILTRETMFGIEPLSLHDTKGPTNLMIMYDYRDLNVTESESDSQFCQVIFFDDKGSLHVMNETFRPGRPQELKATASERKIRSHEMKSSAISDSCNILAVADYRAYMGLGESSVQKLVGILTSIYQVADRVFNSTDFGGIRGQRLVMTAIMVHTSYANVEEQSNHYNMKRDTEDALDVVDSLTKENYFRRFCLMHLTSQRSYGKLLGLASQADSGREWNNGICAGAVRSTRNIGLSTPLNVEGKIMPLLKYAMVVTHEVGHNWGAKHDKPIFPECSPNSNHGGKYLMWPNAVNAGQNFQKFSPCSLRDITAVLKSKAHMCFTPYKLLQHTCGDGILDTHEQCDIGYNLLDNDACCLKNCRLRPSATCSPFSHPCCTDDCQVAPKTQACKDNSVSPCYETPFCDGKNHNSCPHPSPLPNNASCGDQGSCWYGNCLGMCETKGMRMSPSQQWESCTCDESPDAMCSYCCRDVSSAEKCINMNVTMTDGDPCLIGYCKKGMCEKSDQSDLVLNGFNSYSPQVVASLPVTFSYILATFC